MAMRLEADMEQRPDIHAPVIEIDMLRPELTTPGYIFLAPYHNKDPGPYIYDNYGVCISTPSHRKQLTNRRVSSGQLRARADPKLHTIHMSANTRAKTTYASFKDSNIKVSQGVMAQ